MPLWGAVLVMLDRINPLVGSVLLSRASISAIIEEKHELGPAQETVAGVLVLVMMPVVAGVLLVMIPAVVGILLVMILAPVASIQLLMMPAVADVMLVMIPVVEGVLLVMMPAVVGILLGNIVPDVVAALMTLVLVVATCTASVNTSFQIT